MTEYIETISNRVVVDEKTGEKKVVELSRHQNFPTTYKFIVKRFNAIMEEGTDTPIRVFYSEQECIDWINSLEVSEYDDFFRLFNRPRKATPENLTCRSFHISLDEPECAAFANHYDEFLDQDIVMYVGFTRV